MSARDLPRRSVLKNSPAKAVTERGLSVASVVVGPDGLGVEVNSPCLAKYGGQLLLEAFLLVLPLVPNYIGR